MSEIEKQNGGEKSECTRLFSSYESDMGFLMWIHERLEHVHGESPLRDYMHKFRTIIAEMNPTQRTKATGQGKNSLKKLKKAIIEKNCPR